MPKFSFVLPVKDGGDYLKECVASILAQTHTDFTLHILDNNSKDSSLNSIIDLNDSRIEILKSDKSLTIEENWSRILSLKKNEFMVLTGHDDLFYPDYLEKFNQLIEVNNGASLYLSHFNIIDSNGSISRRSHLMPNRLTVEGFTEAILMGDIDIVGTGYMMRSKDYDACGGIPIYPNLLYSDYVLWIRLVSKKYLAVLDDCLFAFRVHDSTTTKSSDKVMLTSFSKFVCFLSELRSFSPLLNNVITENASYFFYRQCKGMSHRLLRTELVNRDNLRVKSVVDIFISNAKTLDVYINPYRKIEILLAYIIDSNSITRWLFLGLKRVYPRPLFK